MKNVKVPATFIRNVVDYIKVAQTTVAQNNYQKRQLYEKVAHAVECMIDKGLAAPEDRSNLIIEMTNYPEKIAEALAQISQKTDLPPLGASSKYEPDDQLDSLTRFALTGSI